MGGIHGDEPAGVAAICAHTNWPLYVAVFPCVNALGLVYNRRYADWDHYKEMQAYLRSVAKDMPPKLVIDLHEDDEAEEAGFYFYHNGKITQLQDIVRQAIREEGLPIVGEDKGTRTAETIVNGVIYNAEDDSIDNWLNKEYGAEVIVCETPSALWPKKTRMRAHGAVLRAIPKLWECYNHWTMTKEQRTNFRMWTGG
jgi:hypothetical protein